MRIASRSDGPTDPAARSTEIGYPSLLVYWLAEPLPMTIGRCPYNIAGKCTVYEHRFAGCRIFCCKGDRDFQSRLSESALKRLMSICEECGLPYTYKDLAAALNGPART